jgi:hypothetical protein
MPLSDHSIDRHQRTNQFDYGCNIFASETTAAFSDLRSFKFADAEELTVFPHPGIGIVRTDAARITPGVDGQQVACDSRSNVHWAALHAYDKSRDPNKPD